MKNVAEIQSIAESGDLAKAHEALDGLLEMGPRNVEALKLRARLFEVSGRFQQEAKIWDQIARIDRDDDDLAHYIARRQNEDRENFYFTDSLPGGGKRFVTFPRQMIRAAGIGLIGCFFFLILARLASALPVVNHPLIMLSAFALFVISPWLAIITSFFRSVRHITINREGIVVTTRFKIKKLPWSAVDNVFLAQDDRSDVYKLSLIVTTKSETHPNIELDFNENSTPIRARSYFVREIMVNWGEPAYVARKNVDTTNRATLKI